MNIYFITVYLILIYYFSGLHSREFSDRDAANLYVHLINLGFEIDMHENLNGDQIERILYRGK